MKTLSGGPRSVSPDTEREIRDLPWSVYRATVVVEVHRLRCPQCGVRVEKIEQLPSKAPFSKRLEEIVGEACESVGGMIERIVAPTGRGRRHGRQLVAERLRHVGRQIPLRRRRIGPTGRVRAWAQLPPRRVSPIKLPYSHTLAVAGSTP